MICGWAFVAVTFQPHSPRRKYLWNRLGREGGKTYFPGNRASKRRHCYDFSATAKTPRDMLSETKKLDSFHGRHSWGSGEIVGVN